MLDQLVNMTKQGRLAALNIDGVVAVDIDQRGTYLLSLLETHERMLRVIGRIDAVEKIAEVATDVAGLAQPHDTAPSDLSRFGFDHFHRWIDQQALI
jgi:hypothetical protein